MRRRPPRSTRTDTLCPTRRSSDLNPAAQYNGLVGGNPDLDPEVADTYTVGVVLTPTFLPGFAATVDYFDITLDGAISILNPDVTIETCIDTGDPFLCSLIHRDTRGSLWIGNTGFVEATNQNIGSLSTTRSDKRRVGKEGVSTGRSWWSPYP